jgi:hypothetical protein
MSELFYGETLAGTRSPVKLRLHRIGEIHLRSEARTAIDSEIGTGDNASFIGMEK